MNNEIKKIALAAFIVGEVFASITNPLHMIAYNKFNERNLDNTRYVVPTEVSTRVVDCDYDGKNEAVVMEYNGTNYLFKTGANGFPYFQRVSGLENVVK